MRLTVLALTACGLQGYVEPTTYLFSDLLTMIRGTNNAGKSAIRKIIEVFAWEPSSNKKKSLLNERLHKGNGSGYACLFLYDMDAEVLAYKLTYVLNESKVEYQLYTPKDELIKIWHGHSDEILKLLNWVVVEDRGEKILLNFKRSGFNLFVDTPGQTTASILDSLCYVEDYEIRLKNITNALDRISYVETQLSNRLSKKVDELKMITFTPTENLVSTIETTENGLENLKSIFNSMQYLLAIEEFETNYDKLKDLNYINDLLSTKLSIEYLNSMVANENTTLQLSEVEDILVNKELISALSTLADCHSTVSKNSEIESLLATKQAIEILQNTQKVEKSLDELTQLESGIEEILQLMYLEKQAEQQAKYAEVSEVLNKFEVMLLDIKNVSTIAWLESLNLKTYKQINDLDNAENLIKIYKDYSIVYNLSRYEASIQLLSHKTDTLSSLELFLEMYIEKMYIDSYSKRLQMIDEVYKRIPTCPTCGRVTEDCDKKDGEHGC